MNKYRVLIYERYRQIMKIYENLTFENGITDWTTYDLLTATLPSW